MVFKWDDVGIGLLVGVGVGLLNAAVLRIPFLPTIVFIGVFIFSQNILQRKLDLVSYVVGGIVLPIIFIALGIFAIIGLVTPGSVLAGA